MTRAVAVWVCALSLMACSGAAKAAPLTLAQACAQTALPRDLSTAAKLTAYEQRIASLSLHADAAATAYLAKLETTVHAAISHNNTGYAVAVLMGIVPGARTAC